MENSRITTPDSHNDLIKAGLELIEDNRELSMVCYLNDDGRFDVMEMIFNNQKDKYEKLFMMGVACNLRGYEKIYMVSDSWVGLPNNPTTPSELPLDDRQQAITVIEIEFKKIGYTISMQIYKRAGLTTGKITLKDLNTSISDGDNGDVCNYLKMGFERANEVKKERGF